MHSNVETVSYNYTTDIIHHLLTFKHIKEKQSHQVPTSQFSYSIDSFQLLAEAIKETPDK